MVKAVFAALAGVARHRLTQIAISLAVSGLLLWFLMQRTDLAEIGRQLSHVNLRWLLLGILAYWIALLLRSWRWRILLAPVRPLGLGQVFYGLLVGYAANYVLPFRLGELLRADFLGRRYAISRLSIIGTIVVERLFDVIVFIGFFFAGLTAVRRAHDSQIARILPKVEYIAIGCVVLAVLLLVLVQVRHKPLPRPFHFLEDQLKSLAEGLHLITGLPEVALLAAATVVVWTADTLSIWFLARALGTELEFQQMLLVMGMSCLSALIPLAPANIGVQQAALQVAFALLGMPTDVGFSLATLIQACFIVGSTLIGGGLYLAATIGSNTPRAVERPSTRSR